MNKITIIACCIFLCGISVNNIKAQEAQEILGIAKEVKSVDYYEQQSDLWEAKTNNNPKDAYAWLQYYKAERAFQQKSNPQLWASDQTAIFKKLNLIIGRAKQHVGDSFEYYLMLSANTVNKRISPVGRNDKFYFC